MKIEASLAIDDYLSRTDTVGRRSVLTDALGSTIAELDDAVAIQAEHTYDPFGATTTTGVSGNSFRYTGRERDETGLYYHRARYYVPGYHRFLSEDPIGWRSSEINAYVYVGNDPVGFVDPLGLERVPGPVNPFAPVSCPNTYSAADGGLGCRGGGIIGGGGFRGGGFGSGGSGVGGGAGGSPHAGSGGTNWGNPRTLSDHFQRHGKDFNAPTVNDYARQAADFLRRSQQEGLPTKIGPDGAVRVYDPKTNTFGSYSADGTTRTFFKPTNPNYFEGQPGAPPWTP